MQKLSVSFLIIMILLLFLVCPVWASSIDTNETAVTSSALEDASDVVDQDFQTQLLDKLDVIIYLLAFISAACLFLSISLIVKFFGWIFANIFKEIF